jgi:hypothetical protein
VRAALLATALIVASPAAALAQSDPYRWCAVYGGFRSTTSNCYFMTLDQCRATISGIGGYCRPNPFYTGPATKPRKKRKSPRNSP